MAKLLKDFSWCYHRNGVCGIGFYNCRFTHVENGKKYHMNAVVFMDDDGKCDYYAVTTDKVNDCWRGDHFIDDIKFSIGCVPSTSITCG